MAERRIHGQMSFHATVGQSPHFTPTNSLPPPRRTSSTSFSRQKDLLIGWPCAHTTNRQIGDRAIIAESVLNCRNRKEMVRQESAYTGLSLAAGSAQSHSYSSSPQLLGGPSRNSLKNVLLAILNPLANASRFFCLVAFFLRS